LDETAIRLTCERIDRRLDLDSVAHGSRDELDPHPRRGGLDLAQLSGLCRIVRMLQRQHPGRAGRDLLENLQPFAADRKFKTGESGGVAARTRQARDQSGADRIK